MSSGCCRVRTKMKFISANDRKWIRPLPTGCPKSAATSATTSMSNVPSAWQLQPQRCEEALQHCFYPKVRWNLLGSKAAVQLRLFRVPSIYRRCRHSQAVASLSTSNIYTVTIRWAQPNLSLQTRHRRATAKVVYCARITTQISVKSLAKRQCLDFRARTRRMSARTATRFEIVLTRSC